MSNPISPPFTIKGKKFALTIRDGGEARPDMVVVFDKFDNGTEWDSWAPYGLSPGINGGMLVENMTDEKILEHGSLYLFMQWCCSEAVRRATYYMDQAVPLPDPNDRLARATYALTQLIKTAPDGAGLTLPPPPLP